MTKARAAILLLLSICSAFSVLWGVALERSARGIIVDFKIVYYGARCLLENRDLYNEKQLETVYRAEDAEQSSNPGSMNELGQVVTLQVYLPTAFFCMAPVALLPWWAAHLLWTGLIVATFTLAAFLMWTLAQAHAPNATFYLIAFLLANSGILFVGGNPAGLAIGLCLVGVWCLLKNKYVNVGIFCLAVSLEIKPHDTGLVWLYFLLAGGMHRKRALQTLALTIALAVPAILWTFHVSPHWMQELASNLSVTSVRGGITDPGPSSISGTSGGTFIDLQTVISVFRDDPRFYNPATYLICGSLLLVWTIVTVRARATLSKDYIALATIATLSMLPIYHRPHDAKLLLLTIPVSAMLLAEGGVVGRLGFLVNSVAILITSDLPLAMLAVLTQNLHLSTGGLLYKIVMVFVARPIPIILLALASFYLWLYVRRSLDDWGVNESPNEALHKSQIHSQLE
jgi:hypothetical protein